MAEERTQLDDIKRGLLNKRWIAFVVLFVALIVGIGAFTDAITKIKTFVADLGPSTGEESENDHSTDTRDDDSLAKSQSSQPDLIITSIGEPRWDAEARMTRIQVRVKNVGAGYADETLVKVIDGSTTNPDTNSSHESTAKLPGLRADEEDTVTVTFPYWVLNPNAELQVLVDPANTVYESDEDNNSKAYRKVG